MTSRHMLLPGVILGFIHGFITAVLTFEAHVITKDHVDTPGLGCLLKSF